MLTKIIKKHWSLLILIFLISAYIIYFSYLTILRYQTLYASYFDLGIMHQTVYNTYKAITTFDWSRVLELTNPYGSEQIKRMAIHNDLILALLSPFYFIHSGPETLLIVQTVIMALGAVGIYKLVLVVFKQHQQKNLLAIIFVFAYLIYPPIQRSNIYDFHAVTLTTAFLIFMFYCWLVKKYFLSSVFLVLSLLSKEQLALTTLFFGFYTIFCQLRTNNFKNIKLSLLKFPIFVTLLSLMWFVFSLFFIIPFFRGGAHFALTYYEDLNLSKFIFHIDTARYFFFLLGPLGFISLFSPIQLLIAMPEFAINLLSSSWHMRNIIFHYTSVIQPFIFISGIYGAKKLIDRLKLTRIAIRSELIIAIIVLFSSLVFAYFKGPLPYSREEEIHPFKYPQKERNLILYWKDILKDDKIKVSATGQLAPHFTSRRYFYIFSKDYYLADYIVLRPDEIYNYPEKDILIPIYNTLLKDNRFQRIYTKDGLEVFTKNY